MEHSDLKAQVLNVKPDSCSGSLPAHVEALSSCHGADFSNVLMGFSFGGTPRLKWFLSASPTKGTLHTSPIS